MKKMVFLALFLVVLTGAFAQNVTFNGYWEAPNGWIFLFKERIHIFVNPDGSFMGGSGGFAANARQFTMQQRDTNETYTFIFDYTVIDSGSIRVTDTGSGNAWANGTWRKRINIPGTKLNHQLIGYWEGRIGDTTRILYFAGSDIVPAFDLKWYAEDLSGQLVPQDGWAFDFDRENNLVKVSSLFFDRFDGVRIFLGNPPGYDAIPRQSRFDGADLLVEQYSWETPNTEIRFVRK